MVQGFGCKKYEERILAMTQKIRETHLSELAGLPATVDDGVVGDDIWFDGA